MWLFTGEIPIRIQMLALVASIGLLIVIIQLIRHRMLKEGYSIVWFLIGLAIVLLSAFPRLLGLMADSLGIHYAPAALFVILVGGLFLLSIHFSVLVTRYDREVRELAQEHAMLKEQIEKNNVRK